MPSDHTSSLAASEAVTNIHGSREAALSSPEEARPDLDERQASIAGQGAVLGRVDIHRVARTDPTRCIIAEKLVSVLS